MESAKRFIVKKLFQKKYIGERHTSIANLPKGLPGHLRGDVKQAAKELIADGILLAKPTSYGLEVSLNPKKMKEIDQYL